ncbi:hypothetical protein B5X24_HaOG212203 [Helicoverpa armigera]|nr:hypothetical protein B5X24_HaOG212203 [Helicoverpa armigera]
MAITLKCNSCNVVIDELLCYIKNKISIIDEESLIKICADKFDSDDIKKSKALLFESMSGPAEQRKPGRKGQGKEVRNLRDIISVFKTAEPDDMPIFVAKNLELLPPITFDHLDVTEFMKRLTVLEVEVREMKTSYVSVDHLKNIRKEFQTGRSLSDRGGEFVHEKRGAHKQGTHDLDVEATLFEHSDRFETPYMSYISTPIDTANISERSTNVDNLVLSEGICESQPVALLTENAPQLVGDNEKPVSEPTTAQLIDATVQCKQTVASVLKTGLTTMIQNTEDKPWTVVRYNRAKKRVKDIIALQETWLSPEELAYLHSISDDFGCTGTSSMDTSAGILRGRPYGGLAILWRKSAFNNVSVIQCNSERVCAIKIVLNERSVLVFNVYMPTDVPSNLVEFTDCLSLTFHFGDRPAVVI